MLTESPDHKSIMLKESPSSLEKFIKIERSLIKTNNIIMQSNIDSDSSKTDNEDYSQIK
jgi:hypothetical protein